MAETPVTTDMNMNDLKLFPWWLLLVWGILALLIGVAFFMTPGMTTVLLITFLGAYWFVGGLFSLCSLAVDKSNMGWKIFLGIINMIIGILILIYPFYSTIVVLSFLVIFIGFWAVFIGVSHIVQAFTAKDAGNGVLGFISIIFGFVLLINPFISAELLPFVIGAFAIVFGLAAIVFSFTAKKCVDAVKA